MHFGCYVLHTGRAFLVWIARRSPLGVLDFTCTLGVVFYNRRDLFGFPKSPKLKRGLPVLSFSLPSNTVPSSSLRERFDMAQGLRCIKIMEATQRHPNLLSEKQAAKRLGVARITLLRAREAGRIRFFRIGTRVLYSNEHLVEFLASCERTRESSQRKTT
jgi:excisionase family DNA binding protein